MTKRLQVLILAAGVVLLASPAFAQAHAGVRAGVSSDPDQFFFGGHIETKPLIPKVTFRPNAEIGVGDNVTTIALNFEFVYSIPIERQPWRVYLGGGPAMNIYNFDGDSDIRGGFNFVVGVQHDKGLFGEIKVGAIDSPSFKFAVGYAFK